MKENKESFIQAFLLSQEFIVMMNIILGLGEYKFIIMRHYFPRACPSIFGNEHETLVVVVSLSNRIDGRTRPWKP